jgi:hypothetical protein
MTDVRCPMCGELNPAERDNCQFCDARLVPLVVPPSDESDLESSSEKAEEAPDQDGALPDWMNDLRSSEFEDQEGFEEAGPEERLPEWLSASDAFSESPSESDAKDSEAMPDWLARLGSEEAEPEEPAEHEESGEGPGWLLKIRARHETETSGVESQEPSAPPEEEEALVEQDFEEEAHEGIGDPVFDEIDSSATSGEEAGLEESGQEGPAGEDAESEEPIGEQPAEETGPPQPEGEEAFIDLEQVLEDEDEIKLHDEELPEDEEEAKPEEAEAPPAWPERAEEEISQPTLILPDEEVSEEGAIFPLVSPYDLEEPDSETESLPDWISEVTPDDISGQGISDEEDDQASGLAPAALPSWLEAMRPVEDAAPLPPTVEPSEGPAEKAGPLAGLSNVLPVDLGYTSFKKPSTYSAKLQVTENQQANAALLEQILATEDEAREIPARQGVSSLAVLRLFVALILLVAVLLPRWIGMGWFMLPTEVPPEVAETDRLINALPAGSPVLLAIDYEPALSGELDLAAAGVVSQLMARGANLALVSTLPAGPVNAERFMAAMSEHQAVALSPYYNLGYLSGGQAGLRGFAEDTRSVFPFTIDTRLIWELSTFERIQSLADFGMVVVVTENPEISRGWIEQVQPVLQARSVPLVMVVSTQAEPMVRPYYATFPRQVDGLVAGLPGGAAFEQQAGVPGRVSSIWDSYGAGLLAAVLLLTLGGFVAAVVNIFSRRTDAQDEAPL